MPDLWSPEELATRFAAYIEELHEFFDCHRMPHGSPEDILALAERLDAPGPFRNELNSMLRAIILRQGGFIPHTELLEILAIAAGGTAMDPTAPQFQPAFRKLLSLIAGTLRRPWNEPPGEPLVSLAEADPTPPELNNLVPFPVRKAFNGSGREMPPPPPDELEFDPSVTFANAVAARIAASAPAPSPVAPVVADQPEKLPPPEEPAASADSSASADPAPASVPSRFTPSLRHLLMMSGGTIAAALVITILLMHGHSDAPAATPLPSTAVASPLSTQAAAAQPLIPPSATPKPSAGMPDPAASAQAPVRHHSSDEDDQDDADAGLVAAPWTGPKPPPIDSVGQKQPSPAAQTQPSTRPSLNTAPAQPASDELASGSSHPLDASLYRSGGPESLPPRVGGALSDHPGYLDVSSGVMADNLIAAPMPAYPTIAHLTHTQGEVILQAVINKEGQVSATHVLSGHRLLRSAAVDAVRRWRYRPYRVDGRPVDVATIITVKFHDHH